MDTGYALIYRRFEAGIRMIPASLIISTAN